MTGERAPSELLGSRPATRRTATIWAVATVVLAVVLALVPLHWQGRYYFYGDTQVGAFGQWYELGRQLRSGHWPLLNLTTWRAGNYTAEGQWGLWNPLVMLIGLVASGVANAVTFVTVLKVGMIVLASSGGFVLARSYGVRPELAFVAGVALPLGGTTQYLDSPTWVTGLLVWGLLPWAWWGIRRTLLHDRSPIAGLGFGYLIVTVGYVYGTIFLAFVYAANLLDAVLIRDRRAFLRVLGMGVLAGLLAVTVYLPGVLTAPVTVRSGTGLANDGRFVVDVRDLIVGVLPTGVVPMSVTQRTLHPLAYMAWFVPVLLWAEPARLRPLVRPMAGLLVVLTISTLWVLGPSVVGPLRYPARVMPYVVLTVAMATAVIASHAVRRPTQVHLMMSLAWVGLAAYLSSTRALGLTGTQVATALVVGAALTLLWLLWRWAHPALPMTPTGGSVGPRSGDGGRGALSGTRHVPTSNEVAVQAETSPARAGGTVAVVGTRLAGLAAIGVVCAVATSILLVMQHQAFPEPRSTERNMPTLVSDYQIPVEAAVGDAMMIGNPVLALNKDPAIARDFLLASSWLVSEHPVQNGYSTISFRDYARRYCIAPLGTTCPDTLATLFTAEPTSGIERVDLLSISTLLIYKADVPPEEREKAPFGWRVAKEDKHIVMWVREDELPAAGGVVSTSDGTRVETVSSESRTVTVRVEDVPETGGRVTFSRLAWPGYRVSGAASLGPSLDDYLLTVDVPASARGETLTVRFSPPGWPVAVAAWLVSVLVSMGWVLWPRWRRRRTRAEDLDRADGISDDTARTTRP